MSTGVTPAAGIGLREEDYPNTMVSAGPICKKAEDLAPFLKVLIGTNVTLLKLDDPVNVKYLKVFYQEESGDLRVSKVNKAMRAALCKAVEHLKDFTGSATKVIFFSIQIGKKDMYPWRIYTCKKKRCVYILQIKIPGSENSFKLWKYWMSRENLNYKLEITGRRVRIKFGLE